MEENTFEIFEGELGVQLKEEPPPKPVRQLRRADAQSSKRKKEAPPSPRGVPRETPRPLPSPPVLSTPELTDEENPWEGVTLNRCLLVAVIIIVISSGVNSVNETLGAFWGSEEGEEPMEDLALTSTGLQQDNSPEQTESSLWDSLFWWSWGSKDDSSDDDDDDDGSDDDISEVHEELRRVKHREKSAKQLLKEKEDTTAGKRDKERSKRREEKVKERVGGKREKEKLLRDRHNDDDDDEEEERPRRKREKEEIHKRERRQG